MTAEVEQSKGFLLVITGPSGIGKDFVIGEVLKHPTLTELEVKRLVTYADRPPRPGEIDGIDYYFVTPEKLDELFKKGELVEKPKTTGSSRKGTPKHEFHAVLNGEKRLWRIEASLASKVSAGTFFDEQFDTNQATILKDITTVVCITAPKEQIEKRRMSRDGDKYNPKEYELRDAQDEKSLTQIMETAVVINNLEGQVDEVVSEIVSHTVKHHDKVKKTN